MHRSESFKTSWRGTDTPGMRQAVEACLHLLHEQPSLGWWFATSYLLAGPVILLHEVGHAIAARALLDGEVSVTVGQPGGRWRFSTCGVDFELGAPVMFGRRLLPGVGGPDARPKR
jgi:hypothetical protein